MHIDGPVGWLELIAVAAVAGFFWALGSWAFAKLASR